MTRAFSSSVLPLMQYWRGMLVWLCLWCGGPNHFSSTGWQQQRSVVHAWTTTTPARSSPLSLLRRRRRSRTTPLPHSTTTTTTSTHRVVLHASADSESSNHKKQLTLFSPSKINLFLRIVRKRPDGYHDLASLFQAIGLGDRLDLELVDSSQDDVNEIAFTCNMPGVPVDETNLVVRAIRLMQSKTNTTTTSQFAAHLEKQVPAQAGLGGGSANAATAMWGVNELLGRPATLEQMVEWSGELGSDITFFLSRGTAYCTGRGEIMDALDPPFGSTQKVCIVKPDIGLSTPSVFQALQYDQLSPLDADEVLLPAFLQHPDAVTHVSYDYFVNDLEPPAFSCIPALQTLKDVLLETPGLDHVLMSGSGTSIYCLGEPKDMDTLLQQLSEAAQASSLTVQVFGTEFVSRPDQEWYSFPATPTTVHTTAATTS